MYMFALYTCDISMDVMLHGQLKFSIIIYNMCSTMYGVTLYLCVCVNMQTIP